MLLEKLLSSGLNERQRVSLVKKIQNWQEKIALTSHPWSPISPHSIGSPLDKTSLILVPLVASVGVPTLKIHAHLPKHSAFSQTKSLMIMPSSADKLQSIPGFQIPIRSLKIQDQLSSIRAVFFSLKLYPTTIHKNIRATFNFPSSDQGLLLRSLLTFLMCGAKKGIFDIQVGDGSSLKSVEKAKNLAYSIKKACMQLRIDPSFILSDMSQPLGQAFGDTHELIEALEILKAKGPLDVLKLCLELGAEMLVLAKRANHRIEAKEMLRTEILKGNALEKFREIIMFQGGDSRVIDDYSLFCTTAGKAEIRSPKKGFIQTINMTKIFSLYYRLREKSGPKAARSAGFLIFKKKGDWVDKGEALAELHFHDKRTATQVIKELEDVFHISETSPDFQPLIINRMRAQKG